MTSKKMTEEYCIIGHSISVAFSLLLVLYIYKTAAKITKPLLVGCQMQSLVILYQCLYSIRIYRQAAWLDGFLFLIGQTLALVFALIDCFILIQLVPLTRRRFSEVEQARMYHFVAGAYVVLCAPFVVNVIMGLSGHFDATVRLIGVVLSGFWGLIAVVFDIGTNAYISSALKHYLKLKKSVAKEPATMLAEKCMSYRIITIMPKMMILFDAAGLFIYVVAVAYPSASGISFHLTAVAIGLHVTFQLLFLLNMMDVLQSLVNVEAKTGGLESIAMSNEGPGAEFVPPK